MFTRATSVCKREFVDALGLFGVLSSRALATQQLKPESSVCVALIMWSAVSSLMRALNALAAPPSQPTLGARQRCELALSGKIR